LLTLGKSQKPVVMSHYPHMLSEDIGVWSKYLSDPIVPIKDVWYDVRVGKPVRLSAGASEMELRIAAGLTRKRIDVVAAVGGGFWVIEVKPIASMLALGQILSYRTLFVQEYAVQGEVWPVVVCDEIDDDLIDEFGMLGVSVIVND